MQPSWLQLLIDDCSVDELEAYRARALASAAGDAAVIESEARRALHLHALLVDQRRHAAELTVLNDLARQLSAMRQPSEVLREVAVQARRLLAVDLAYIMLADDEGVLHMEVVEAPIGSALRGTRMSRGTGVGGVVMETGQPHWTEDYLHDPTLQRPVTLHDAAVREGLTAILGVPLRVGAETLGVLFAADRHVRRFSEHEIGLLSSLAAHAAIAIHNATLFDQYQRVTVDLERSNELNRRAVELHDRLTAAVLRGGGLDDVAGVLAGALDAAVVVLDAGQSVLAAHCGSGAGFADGERDAAVPPGVAELTRARVLDSTEGPTAVAPIILGERYAGCLIARRTLPFDEGALRSVESAATVVGLVVASDQAVAEAERRAHGEFLTALLSGHPDEASLRRRARQARVDLEGIRGVVVLEDGTGGAGSSAGRLARHLVRDAGGWAAEYGGRWVVLLPIPDLGQIRDMVRSRLPDGRSVTAGLASAPGTVTGLQAAHQAAEDCVSILFALGQAGTCALADEFGIYRSLLSRAGRYELERFVQATVGPLEAADRSGSGELMKTLEAYLTQAGKHRQTAEVLHIHVNTLYQRLARISAVLGESWQDAGRRLELQLALRLRQLTSRLDDGRPARS